MLDDYNEECEMFGCDERLFWTEGNIRAFICDRCGAEWTEEVDHA